MQNSQTEPCRNQLERQRNTSSVIPEGRFRNLLFEFVTLLRSLSFQDDGSPIRRDKRTSRPKMGCVTARVGKDDVHRNVATGAEAIGLVPGVETSRRDVYLGMPDDMRIEDVLPERRYKG